MCEVGGRNGVKRGEVLGLIVGCLSEEWLSGGSFQRFQNAGQKEGIRQLPSRITKHDHSILYFTVDSSPTHGSLSHHCVANRNHNHR